MGANYYSDGVKVSATKLLPRRPHSNEYKLAAIAWADDDIYAVLEVYNEAAYCTSFYTSDGYHFYVGRERCTYMRKLSDGRYFGVTTGEEAILLAIYQIDRFWALNTAG